MTESIPQRRESDAQLKHLGDRFDQWMEETRTHRNALDNRLVKIEQKQDCLSKTMEKYKPFLSAEIQAQQDFVEYKKAGVKAIVATSAVATVGAAAAASWAYFKKSLGL